MRGLWYFTFILSSLGSSPFSVAAETTYTFKKNIQLWEKKPGAIAPEAIILPWAIEESVVRPTEGGTFTSFEKVFLSTPFRVTISFFWIQPPDLTQSDYWVTQTKLEAEGFGVIAECSRLNEPKPGRSIGIGACSGGYQQRQIGVTIH